MKKTIRFQKACMALCLIISLVSGSICAATALEEKEVEGIPSLPASMSNVSQVQAAEPKASPSSKEDVISDDDCLYVFYKAWEGFDFKPSEYSDEYEVGDEIKITIMFNRSVESQIASNVEGEWTTFPAQGNVLEATFLPDDDWLNLQITDMKETSSVGIVSIDIEITLKNAAKLKRMNYTQDGDYELFSGGFEEAYETDDLWLSYCEDSDWLTLVYDCNISGQEGWGILGWGGSLNGEWINGPGYGADKKNSMAEVSVDFTVKYLRRMMGLSKDEELDFTSLGAWGGGRIKSLTLHRGSQMPRSDVLFENGAENEEWVCKDLEQLLDENGARYLCLKYTCTDPENYGWSVLGWGAGVDGEWRSGKSYKVSDYQPDRAHYACMTVEEFRQSMGLSWDVKVDSISLGAYNNGQILKLWLSDTPVSDPGDDVEFEEKWESENAKIYKRVAYAEGTVYPQNINLASAWEQAHPDKEAQIIESLGKDVYLVVSYHSAKKEVPTLYISMKDGTQSHVKAVWSDGKKAVYSYDCIRRMFKNYLIPEEMESLAISTGEHPMTISEVKTVIDHERLEEEPIAVLTKDWSGFETKISEYHSGYQPGDRVKVTVKFDKIAPGTVAFNLNGKWKAGEMQTERKFSVTATPDDDYMSIQVGEIPRTKSYVIIRDIQIEIVGKTNYDAAIREEGEKAALLAVPADAASRAVGLTDEQIKEGRQLVITSASSSLLEQERKMAQEALGAFAEDESSYVLGDCVDITLSLKDKKGNSIALHTTQEPLRFKVPIPSFVDPKEHDFGVIRLHEGSADILPDLDDEDATITFASNRFSKYVVVYGPKDCFKELRGDTSIHTFTKAWDNWDIKLNDYITGNVGFGAGDTVKITVEFNKHTSSAINTNVNETWTTLGEAKDSTTLTVVGKPDGDSVALQITDMLGEKSVKVMKVTVEIMDSSPLPVFTEAGETSITLQKFLKDFAAGMDKVKITVQLSSDGEFKGNLEGNTIEKSGTGWNKANGGDAFESENGKSTYTWITTPQYGSLTLKIYEMTGSKVSVNSIVVERTDEDEKIALPVFTKAGEKNIKLTNFLTDLVPGTDFVEVTVKLSSDGSFKGNLEGNIVQNNQGVWGKANGGNDYESDKSAVYTWKLTPQYDSITLKINEMSGSEVKVDSIRVERTTPDPIIPTPPTPDVPQKPETVLFTLTSDSKTKEIKLVDYNSDYIAGDQVEVTIKMSSDGYFNGSLGTNTGGSWSSLGFQSDDNLCSMPQWVVTPDGDSLQIECWNTGNTGVKVTSIIVDILKKGEKPIEPDPGETLHTFTATWDGFEQQMSEYNANFRAETETTINLTFDKEVGAQIACHTADSDWYTISGEGKEISLKITPKDEYLNIQLTDMKGASSVRLLKVEVLQEAGPDEPVKPDESIHTFTATWDGFEQQMSEYNANFRAETETTINLTFDKEVGAQVACHTTDSDWYTVSGEGKEISLKITPKDEYLNIQLTDMKGASSVKLLKVEVLQEAEPDEPVKPDESIHTFKKEMIDGEFKIPSYSLKLAEYCPEYEAEDFVTITVELSSEKGFNGILEGNVVDTSADSGYTWKKANGDNPFGSGESGGKQKATFTWTVQPKYGDLSVSIWWIEDDAQQVYIDAIEVTKDSNAEIISEEALTSEPEALPESAKDVSTDTKEDTDLSEEAEEVTSEEDTEIPSDEEQTEAEVEPEVEPETEVKEIQERTDVNPDTSEVQ